MWPHVLSSGGPLWPLQTWTQLSLIKSTGDIVGNAKYQVLLIQREGSETKNLCLTSQPRGSNVARPKPGIWDTPG